MAGAQRVVLVVLLPAGLVIAVLLTFARCPFPVSCLSPLHTYASKMITGPGLAWSRPVLLPDVHDERDGVAVDERGVSAIRAFLLAEVLAVSPGRS